jgi:peptidoglycan/xylan/chitin deacetylase (PgdA/CDA1 family)
VSPLRVLGTLVSWWLIALCFGCAGFHQPQAPKEPSIVISIDMCQAHKPYEKKLFLALEDLGRKQGRPVPIAVAIAGGWIRKHRAELAELKKMYLNITWVNHSYTHPIEDDFLNNPKVNFRYEVMANVELMKQNGLTPSKYFRFPGLRHNASRLKQLHDLGYLNLDADAWLGQGQKIKAGSIVLIHGNGNEEPGVVDKFIAYLKTENKYKIVPVSSLRP